MTWSKKSLGLITSIMTWTRLKSGVYKIQIYVRKKNLAFIQRQNVRKEKIGVYNVKIYVREKKSAFTNVKIYVREKKTSFTMSKFT